MSTMHNIYLPLEGLGSPVKGENWVECVSYLLVDTTRELALTIESSSLTTVGPKLAL